MQEFDEINYIEKCIQEIKNKSWKEIVESVELVHYYHVVKIHYCDYEGMKKDTPEFLLKLISEEERDRVSQDGKIMSGGFL